MSRLIVYNTYNGPKFTVDFCMILMSGVESRMEGSFTHTHTHATNHTHLIDHTHQCME